MARGRPRLRRRGSAALAVLALGLVGWQLGVSRAGRGEVADCAKCAPVAVSAVTEARGFFIAHTELDALKSAREFAFRIASERVVRKVEQSPLRCPDAGCVDGKVELTTGVAESFPCRRGILGKQTRSRRLAKKHLAEWRKACVETLDHAAQCDDSEVQRSKPAWAECKVEVWAKKTRGCAPPHCRAPAAR